MMGSDGDAVGGGVGLEFVVGVVADPVAEGSECGGCGEGHDEDCRWL